MANEVNIITENPMELARVLSDFARFSQEGLRKELSHFDGKLRNRIKNVEWLANWSPTDGHEKGLLKGSVKVTPLVMNGDTATSTIGAYTPYAAIHEYGGTIPAMTIKPKDKKALFWPGAAHPVKSVKRPAVSIREKRYLRNPITSFVNDWSKILTRVLTRLRGSS